MKQEIIIFLFLTGVCIGCLKRQEYPIEPRIELDRFEVGSDSATLVFTFTDGDGNFGLKETDYADTSYCREYYNLFCEYYEKENGQWVWWELDPCSSPIARPYYSRVPFAEPSGQFKSQKGEVVVGMKDFYFESDFDTCKFEIYVVDYDQNKSNIVVTQEFVKPN